jgi:elongation factor P--(R)-beta-lysine ligase
LAGVLAGRIQFAKPVPGALMTDRPTPWWDSHIHADRRPLLIARNRIVAAIRDWFAGQGFIEVDCGALQVSPGNEAHLHAFATTLVEPDGTRRDMFLHTSPEFACKKLLAAGEARIFSLGKVYRNREATPLHAPEFTMLEWYRAGAPYRAIMDDCIALLRLAATITGIGEFHFRGSTSDPSAPPEYLTVDEAFKRHADVDLLATIDKTGRPDRDALAKQSPVKLATDDSWSDIFSRIISERVESRLGMGRPTLLYEYPVAEAALARASPRDARVAERFELYVCGVELANGFGELTDAKEQRLRFEMEMDEKQRLYGESYPIDEDFIAALARMPEASGVALGLDRLVMLATGASRVNQVIWTPIP